MSILNLLVHIWFISGIVFRFILYDKKKEKNCSHAGDLKNVYLEIRKLLNQLICNRYWGM